MKKTVCVAALAAFALLAVLPPAFANLCKSVRDTRTTAETARDVAFFEEMFPDPTDRGDLSWNKIVVQCNRQRDTKGKEIAAVTQARGANAGKTQLLSANLPPKAIRGHYNFFGTLATQQKYVYALEKKGDEWIMTIPYRAIINDVVKGRIDLNFSHAAKLYEASQVTGAPAAPTLVADARPVSTTLCASTTYFQGKASRYAGKRLDQRDKENSAISLGRIDYQYGKGGYTASGCRVDASVDLYWKPDTGSSSVVRVRPGDWVLDNFVRTAETY